VGSGGLPFHFLLPLNIQFVFQQFLLPLSVPFSCLFMENNLYKWICYGTCACCLSKITLQMILSVITVWYKDVTNVPVSFKTTEGTWFETDNRRSFLKNCNISFPVWTKIKFSLSHQY
jgi:hypothetical protein